MYLNIKCKLLQQTNCLSRVSMLPLTGREVVGSKVEEDVGCSFLLGGRETGNKGKAKAIFSTYA